RDRVHPGHELRVAAKLRQVGHHLHQDLLRAVLGVIERTEHALGEPVDRPLQRATQRLERRPVAVDAARGQLLERLRHAASRTTRSWADGSTHASGAWSHATRVVAIGASANAPNAASAIAAGSSRRAATRPVTNTMPRVYISNSGSATSLQ